MKLGLSTQRDIEIIREIESRVMQMPQFIVPIKQSLHAGIYTRIAEIPAGVVLVGALMKIPTMLTVVGDCTMTIGDKEKTIEIRGSACFEAPAGRKTVFRSWSDTKILMSFATNAGSCEEARKEFTDELLQGEY